MEDVRILVVDDDPVAVSTLEEIFWSEMGYRADTAVTGQQALDKIERQFYNIALLDLRLPDMEGTKLLTRLRALHPKTFCIITTGYASKDSSIEAMNQGAYAYIEKPLTLSKVTATVQAALEKQRLEEDNRRLIARLQALDEITDSALSTLELDALLDTILERAVRYLHAHTSAILLLDETGSRLEVRRAWGVEEGELGQFAASLPASFAGQVLRERRPVVVSDADQEPSLAGTYLHRHGVRSLLEVPMRVRERIIGVAHVDTRFRHEFSPEEISLFEKFADRAAVLIENARLYEEQRRLAEQARRLAAEARTLYEVSQNLVESMELQERLRAIATHLCRVTGATRCTIGLREGHRLAVEFVPNGQADERWEIDALAWGPGLRRVLEAGEETLWSAADGPLAEVALWERCHFESALLLPLAYSGAIIGFIGLDEPGRSRDFTPDQVRLARAIAAQAAVAIQNARVFERERTIARTLQEVFLPKQPPVIPGYEIAPCYEAAYANEQVGGDYFDFIELGEGGVGLVLGDVCGKGVAAALYTASAKHTLRAFAMEDPDPQRVVTRLNLALARQMTDECAFVTLVYALLDARTGALTYVNAAHPPPLLYDPRSGEFKELISTGGLVGAWPEIEYSQRRVKLPPGSVLAFYTDGVTEARRGSRMLETGGVRHVIQASAVLSAREIARQIHQAALRQCGGNLRDDVAIVVLKRSDDAAARPDA